ncbi:MAG: S1 family peptidase [Lysobacteraceae bacterium]
MCKHTRTRRRLLAGAILAATALAVGGVATAAPVTNMDPAMAAAIERDLGMSPAQFERYLAVERNAEQAIAMAERRFGENFAGGWIEADGRGGHRVVVATTGRPTAWRSVGAEVRQVRHSLAELEAAVERLNEAAAESGTGSGLQSWGVDVANNTVTVTVSPYATMAASDFVASSGVDARLLDFEVSEYEPSTLINIIGGLRYNGCSIGFPVTRGATKGFVTAGHCGNVGSPVRINNVLVGYFQRSNFPGADAAWATVRQQDTLFNRVWQYSGNSTYAVTGSREAVIGAAVCRSGFRTGWRCGTLTRNNVTVNYGQGSVTGLRESNACAGQGDSGGSWVASGNQAQGVTSGGALGNDGTNCGIPQNQRRTWFQRLNPMLSGYGVNLVVR